MVTSAPVTVIVNGSIVGGVTPAALVNGRVVAPLVPVVVRLVSRASYDARSATVAVERDGKRLTVPVVGMQDGQPYIELRAVALGIGAGVAFDSSTRTLTIELPVPAVIATPVPFDPAAAQVPPRTVFTPSPPAATPRTVESIAPRPRRTAIPAVPSQPRVSPPDPGPTGRRR